MKESSLKKQLIVVIIAEGLNEISSRKTTVLHTVSGIPIIVRLVLEVLKMETRKIFIIAGKNRLNIENELRDYIDMYKVEFISQGELLGTGHAIMICYDKLKRYNHANVLLLPGTAPFIDKELMEDMVTDLENIRICIGKLPDPGLLDRVKIQDKRFKKIINYDNCTRDDLKIKSFHTGIYAIDVLLLCKYIHKIDSNNRKKEYLLSDIVDIIRNYENIPIKIYKIPSKEQIKIMTVNTEKELDEMDCYSNALDIVHK